LIALGPALTLALAPAMSAAAEPSDGLSGQWQLARMAGVADEAFAAAQFTAQPDGEAITVAVRMWCNRFQTTAHLTGEKAPGIFGLRVERDFPTTLRRCDGDKELLDFKYMEIFRKIDTYALRDGRLRLMSMGKVVLEYVRS